MYRGLNKLRLIFTILMISLLIVFVRLMRSQFLIGCIVYNKTMNEAIDPFHNLDDIANNYDQYIVKNPISYYSSELNLSLIMLTVADKFTSIGCDTLRLNTNIHHHSNINILGLGHRAINKRISKVYKLINIYQQLNYLYSNHQHDNQHTIILFVDAFDVIIQTDSYHILSNFIRLEMDKRENSYQYQQFVHKNIIYFSAEMNCYPCDDEMFVNQYPFHNDSNIERKYLNAGLWIATLENAYKLFELIYWMQNEDEISWVNTFDDQYILQKLFVDLYQNTSSDVHILLDYHDILFKSTYQSRHHISEYQDIVKYFGQENRNNDYCPTLHFNSPTEKKKLQTILDEIKRERLNEFYANDKKAIINTNIGQIGIETLCSKPYKSYKIHDPELVPYQQL